MASFSSHDLTADDYWSPSRHYPVPVKERILERLLSQNFSTALRRQASLSQSSRVRTSFSDSALPSSDSSERSHFVSSCSVKPLAKANYVLAPSTIKPFNHQGWERRNPFFRRRNSLNDRCHAEVIRSWKGHVRFRTTCKKVPTPLTGLQSVHCKEGSKYDISERFMSKIGHKEHSMKALSDIETECYVPASYVPPAARPQERPTEQKVTYIYRRQKNELVGVSKSADPQQKLLSSVLPPLVETRDTPKAVKERIFEFLWKEIRPKVQHYYLPTYTPTVSKSTNRKGNSDNIDGILGKPCHSSLAGTKPNGREGQRSSHKQRSHRKDSLTKSKTSSTNRIQSTHSSDRKSRRRRLKAIESALKKALRDPRVMKHISQIKSSQSSQGIASATPAFLAGQKRDAAVVKGRKRTHSESTKGHGKKKRSCGRDRDICFKARA